MILLKTTLMVNLNNKEKESLISFVYFYGYTIRLTLSAFFTDSLNENNLLKYASTDFEQL